MEGLPPAALEVGLTQDTLPVGSDQVVSRAAPLLGEDGEHLGDGLAVVERLDQRLDEGDCPIIGAGVTPAFEVVSRGYVPVTVLRGLVLVEAQVDATADSPQQMVNSRSTGAS